MKRILLIEDESSVVSFIKKGLAEEDYEVSVALFLRYLQQWRRKKQEQVTEKLVPEGS